MKKGRIDTVFARGAGALIMGIGGAKTGKPIMVTFLDSKKSGTASMLKPDREKSSQSYIERCKRLLEQNTLIIGDDLPLTSFWVNNHPDPVSWVNIFWIPFAPGLSERLRRAHV